MKNILLFFCLIILSLGAFSQNPWDQWDKNYKEVDISELLNFEKAYADSVDRGLIEGKYYARIDKFRFSAYYTGEKREISEETKKSMKNAYKLYAAQRDQLSLLDEVRFEYKFTIDNVDYWFSMQSALDKDFKKEVKKDDEVYLYCLFLNEHQVNGKLTNSFLISEFRQ